MGSINNETEKEDEKTPLLPSSREDKPLPFPKSVFFIFLNEFCERYSFYGLEAILALFLRNILLYTENVSTIIYHLFVTISYTTPLIGAIFADSILGKYRTTVYFSVVHSIGNVALALGAMSFIPVSWGQLITILALIVTAVGIGGIKPSVAAFGGDQFVLPQQEAQLTIFFSIYYFSINMGATFSEIITPILRKDVHCLGEDTCYSLAFAVPAVLMILSLVAFVLGKRLYKMKPVTQSVMVNTFKCAAYAIGNKTEANESEHWLDRASDKYDKGFIQDIKDLLQLIIVYSPLIIFWSLWSQQGTTWTFQATRMVGYVTEDFSIKPDQVQVTNSLLILFFIPIFEMVIYPCLTKIGVLTKPLQRITFGCVLMGIAFIIAGCLELQLQKSYPVIPDADHTTFNIINSLNCTVNVNVDPIFVENSEFPNSTLSSENMTLGPFGHQIFQNIYAVDYNITVSPCVIGGTNITFPSAESLSYPGEIHTFLLSKTNLTSTIGEIISSQTKEDLTKSNEGNAKLRIMGVNLPHPRFTLNLESRSQNYSFYFSSEDLETRTSEVDLGTYLISMTVPSENTTDVALGTVDLGGGGSYLLGLYPGANGNGTALVVDYVLTVPNTISMLWLLPQYVLLTFAEVLVAVTGYQFAYEEAPLSMKSLIQSVWLLTNAGGNLVIVIVVGFNVFPNQAVSFFFFVALMFASTILFVVLAHRYEKRAKAAALLPPFVPLPPSAPPTPEIQRRERRSSIAETIAKNVK